MNAQIFCQWCTWMETAFCIVLILSLWDSRCDICAIVLLDKIYASQLLYLSKPFRRQWWETNEEMSMGMKDLVYSWWHATIPLHRPQRPYLPLLESTQNIPANRSMHFWAVANCPSLYNVLFTFCVYLLFYRSELVSPEIVCSFRTLRFVLYLKISVELHRLVGPRPAPGRSATS